MSLVLLDNDFFVTTAESIFLFTSYLNNAANGLFPTSISANSWSWNWYMALTPFEMIFLNFIMLEIFFLRYIEVLPININNWFYGDPSGKRRKKRNIQFINGTNNTINNMSSCEIGNMKNIDQIPEMVFGILKKLDQQECLIRVLCQVEFLSKTHTLKIPFKLRKIMDYIKRINIEDNTETCSTQQKRPRTKQKYKEIVAAYQKAIKFGSQDYDSLPDKNFQQNGTETIANSCETKYNSCPIDSKDISYYLKEIYLE